MENPYKRGTPEYDAFERMPKNTSSDDTSSTHVFIAAAGILLLGLIVLSAIFA